MDAGHRALALPGERVLPRASAEAAIGIRVRHPRSRITRLAELRDVPIHPTQLYSILGNVFLGLLLPACGFPTARWCWWAACTPLATAWRAFIEEAYRGEPQTPVVAGLRLYQWLAVGTVAFGAVLTSLAGIAAQPELHATRSGAGAGVWLPRRSRHGC